jgi:hypothetical protein
LLYNNPCTRCSAHLPNFSLARRQHSVPAQRTSTANQHSAPAQCTSAAHQHITASQQSLLQPPLRAPDPWPAAPPVRRAGAKGQEQHSNSRVQTAGQDRVSQQFLTPLDHELQHNRNRKLCCFGSTQHMLHPSDNSYRCVLHKQCQHSTTCEQSCRISHASW